MGRSVKDFEKEINTKLARAQVEALTTSVQRFKTEFRSVMQMMGATSLVGGGLVASLGLMTNALANFARQGLSLHYASQAIGVTTQQLQQLTVAGQALGLSQEQAAQGVQTALTRLADLKTLGPASSVFQALSTAARGSGVVLAKEMQEAMLGSEGLVGGLKVALTRARELVRQGRPEGARFIMDALQLPFNFKDLDEVIGRLHKRIDPNIPQMKEYMLSWTNLGISMDNIKDRIGMAVMPAFDRLINRLDEFLNTKDVQDALTKFADWVEQIDWNKVSAAVTPVWEGLKTIVNNFVWLFDKTDYVIKAMGLSWPTILTVLIGIKFASWLFGVAGGLAAINRFRSLIGLLIRGGPWIAAALAVSGRTAATTAVDPKSSGDATRDFWLQLFGNKQFGTGGGFAGGESSSPASRGVPFWDHVKEMLFGKPGSSPAMRFTDTDVNPLNAQIPEEGRSSVWDLSGGYSTSVDDRRALTTKRELVDEFRDLQEQLALLNEYFASLQRPPDDLHNIPLGGAAGESNPMQLPETSGQPGGGSSFEARNQPIIAPSVLFPGEAGINPKTNQLFANVRSNNPGAAFPGEIARRFETTGTESLLGGKYKIAQFPSPVHGAAANMFLLANQRDRSGNLLYVGKTVKEATRIWSGSLREKTEGYSSDQIITPEMARDPAFAIPFMKAISRAEAVGNFPMDQAQWDQAFAWSIYGGRPPSERALGRGEMSGAETGGLVKALAGEQTALRGSATVDIDIADIAARDNDSDSLFRPTKLEHTPQMGGTGGTATTYNDLYTGE
jgi:hypothetical protein